MLKKFKYIIIILLIFSYKNVLSGESGDDQNLNNPKELKIDINDVLETLKNKNEKQLQNSRY